ncbi:MAG TPA: hypothetical protein VGC32_03340 [Solirubrobacterales bacterium]
MEVARGPRSVRVRLARVAEGVMALNSAARPSAGRGRWITLDGKEVIVGVVVAGDTAGKVEMQLHLDLVGELVPIEPLAAKIRADVEDRARREGLAGHLGQVDITIHDLILQPAEKGDGR